MSALDVILRRFRLAMTACVLASVMALGACAPRGPETAPLPKEADALLEKMRLPRVLKSLGLDGSARMLELARRAVPGAVFRHGDIRTAEVGGPFDAIVAWDSVFHIP